MVSIIKLNRSYSLNFGLLVIIALNLFIFITINILEQYSQTLNYNYLLLSADFYVLGKRPWPMVTYMFTHTEIRHLILNELCLFLAGGLIGRTVNSVKLIIIYLTGGLFGALFFLFFYSVIPIEFSVNSFLEGSSAAIYAILVFLILSNPTFKIILLNHLSIPIRWIIGGLLIINILGLTGENYAANFAHLGGAFGGVICYIILRLTTSYTNKATSNDEITEIISKIKISGYSSLNEYERNILLNKSK